VTEPAQAVFLSYASQDAQAARRICEALRAGGIEVWFDQSELRGGDAWDQKIRQQIRSCALFVPVISQATSARGEGYFRLEWKIAVDRSHLMASDQPFLVPVVIDATAESTARVPEEFRAVQWTRLPNGETGSRFVEGLARLLSPDAAEAGGTPMRRPAAIAPAGRPGSTPSRLTIGILITAVIGVAALGFIAFERMGARKTEGPSSATPPPAAASLPAAAPPPAAAPAHQIPEKSIAVMPFLDLSEKKDQEYFSDGLSEELIDLLAKGTDMRVAARTSSFYFKGKQVTIAEIATALGVANVLEGSVRKAGQTLRVAAQLIRASDGFQLWSESYDRQLKDVFKVQDEIAEHVVTALKVQLSESRASAGAPRTENTEAYNQYLIGKQAYRTNTVESVRRAVDAFRRAVALDPKFAAGYAGLADAQYFLDSLTRGDAPSTAQEDKSALAEATKAIALDPQLAAGYSFRGLVETIQWDWAGAESDLKKAIELDPHDSAPRRRYGRLLADLGRLPEAIAAERTAAETDPLDPYPQAYLGQYLTASGQFDAARAALLRAQQITPDVQLELYVQIIDLLQGRPESLLAAGRGTNGSEADRLEAIAVAAYTLGHADESNHALNELIEKFGSKAPAHVAAVYAWQEDRDRAFQWLERGLALHDTGLEGIHYNPSLQRLKGDPRYAAVLRKMNLPEN
jgi:TolB-like protein/Flp pilus assembly protein TadD